MTENIKAYQEMKIPKKSKPAVFQLNTKLEWEVYLIVTQCRRGAVFY